MSIHYPIERDKFNKLFYEVFKNDDSILDSLATNLITENYIATYDNEEIFITNKNTLVTISWYKLFHVGRCLNFSKHLSDEEIIEFLNN